MHKFIDEFLEDRKRDGLLRSLSPVLRRKNGRITIGAKEYADFSSNDYLGLSAHSEIIEAAKDALDEFGAGSCASRLMTGNLRLHEELEEKTAKFKNKEAALVFNSGYQANIGIISSLYGKGDCIFCDKLSHASIIDAMLLSGAEFFRFKHNDAGHLESLLKSKRDKFKKCLIVTETVFSMDGDIAPLKELVALKEKYNCSMMVDEAHSTGIFGKNGSGVVEQENLQEKIELVMGTFSKALGSFGAYIACSKKIKEYLINTSRSFIYSTALPASVIAANIKALEIVKNEPQRRKKLLESAQFFRQALKSKGFNVLGDSQIIPVVIGDNFKVLEFAKELKDRGYWVMPVRPPTVPQGQARLRFSLSSHHTKEALERLVEDVVKISLS